MSKIFKIIFAVIVGLIIELVTFDYFVYANTNEDIVFFMDYFPLKLLYAMLEFNLGISFFAFILMLINFVLPNKLYITKVSTIILLFISIIALAVTYYVLKFSTKNAMNQFRRTGYWFDKSFEPSAMFEFYKFNFVTISVEFILLNILLFKLSIQAMTKKIYKYILLFLLNIVVIILSFNNQLDPLFFTIPFVINVVVMVRGFKLIVNNRKY